MEPYCQDSHSYLKDDQIISKNQNKTLAVAIITTLTMVGEIVVGYITGSMALTADGWHMASHAGALFIALFAYKVAKSQKLNLKFSFGAGKVIPLGGFTSAIILFMVAIFVAIESFTRLITPVNIDFNMALIIAVLGLIINLLSALILKDNGHNHEHERNNKHNHESGHTLHEPTGPAHKHVHDYNLRGAFVHVLADALTSVLAIIALFSGKLWGWNWLDPAVGIVGAIAILIWSIQLFRDTGWELLDGHSKSVDFNKLKNFIEKDNSQIVDFHVWRIAPNAIACELVVKTPKQKGIEYYKSILRKEFKIQHIIVEEFVIS